MRPVETVEEQTFTSGGVVQDTRRGLTDAPKWLSSLYFYDARGSELFEAICATPEYYPTRTELSILEEQGDAILAAVGNGLLLAELGSGSSRKTRTLIRALLARQDEATYLPVDVSQTMLQASADALEAEFPGLHVEPVAAEYGAGLRRIGDHPGSPKLVLFLGSSIGNFEPDEQVDLLATARTALSPGDAFLLGTDMVKDAALLEAAYNDAAGVTADFNKNILVHLNRELDGDADPGAFDHVALWDPERQRVEMHLESRRDQTLHFPRADLTVPVAEGERIHTENCYKFTPERVAEMARAAGFTPERTWTDDRGWFGLHLLRA